MKKTTKELTAMSEPELADFVAKERTTMQKHRFGTGGTNSAAVRTARKNIARALTVLKAKRATFTS